MKEKIKKELMNRVGTTWFDKFIYVLKLVTIIFSINITLSLFMGFDDLANSYPRFLWVLAGIIPAIYMVDVFYRSTKGINSLEEFRIMNITSFILFCIHTFIEVVEKVLKKAVMRATIILSAAQTTAFNTRRKCL